MAEVPDEERGMYPKYRVFKIDEHMPDGSVEIEVGPGQFDTLTEVEDPCFVLKFDDPAAQDALWVYANSVKKKYPLLAEDIKEQINQAVARQQTFLGELDEIERLGRIHSGVDDGPTLRELVERPDAVERYLDG